MTTIPPNPEEALVTISTPQPDTVRVRDRVESSRFEFYFDGVSLGAAPTDQLFYPVDVAAELGSTQKISIPGSPGLIVHDADTGNVLEQNGRNSRSSQFGNGRYEIEFMSLPMKIYLQINEAFAIERTDRELDIVFDSAIKPTLGARTHQERPAGTITTPADVNSVMDAVSTFGSALKTTNAERSWPTLRGYPPRIEVGDELRIPDTIQPPETDIQIQLPATHRAVFQTAPLAYYLGATVETLPFDQPDPQVVIGDEAIPLDGDLTEAAARLLQRNLILDCIVRTEGLYPFPIEERTSVEADLPWDPAELYHIPLEERVLEYEQVSQSVLERILPTWPVTIDVEPSAAKLPALPHLAEELAVVRIPESTGPSAEPQPTSIDDFIRADGGSKTLVSRTTRSEPVEQRIMTPQEWKTQIHVSLLEEFPLGSNKTSVQAYERHIEREAPDTGAIEVHIVCNDDEMREEEVVTELYGVRDLLEFDVNFHYKLSKEDLADLLARSFDLIHYIGHVDKEGIKCHDGYLDVATDVESVGVDAFLLNACTSVVQGEALLKRGSMGGIATLYDVPNSSATRLGRTLSRLLTRGFSIRSALEVARESSVLGRRWVSLGDGQVSLTQAAGGFTYTINLGEKTPEGYEFEPEFFETASHRIGSLVMPQAHFIGNHVIPRDSTQYVSIAELEELFELEVSPVRYNGNLYWTDEVSPRELLEE